MGAIKDVVIRLMNGGEDAVAACHEMMPGWISILEKKPPAMALVLAAVHTLPFPVVVQMQADGKLWIEPRYREFYRDGEVTHWQPMPALPYREPVDAAPVPS